MDRFTAVFEQHGDWWVGYVEELPGAHTQERTLDEARDSLKEAARLIIEANRDIAQRSTVGKMDNGDTRSFAVAVLCRAGRW